MANGGGLEVRCLDHLKSRLRTVQATAPFLSHFNRDPSDLCQGDPVMFSNPNESNVQQSHFETSSLECCTDSTLHLEDQPQTNVVVDGWAVKLQYSQKSK